MTRRLPFTARGAIVALCALLTGCAVVTVRSYSNRAFDVGRYRTYAWGPADTHGTGDPRLDNNEFFEARVRQQVDSQLTARGFEKTIGSAGSPGALPRQLHPEDGPRRGRSVHAMRRSRLPAVRVRRRHARGGSDRCPREHAVVARVGGGQHGRHDRQPGLAGGARRRRGRAHPEAAATAANDGWFGSVTRPRAPVAPRRRLTAHPASRPESSGASGHGRRPLRRSRSPALPCTSCSVATRHRRRVDAAPALRRPRRWRPAARARPRCARRFAASSARTCSPACPSSPRCCSASTSPAPWSC